MTHLQDIRSVSQHLDVPDLLAYLLKDQFPGRVIVTASLRAPSIVTLKMIADIDPATPIVFCRAGLEFTESRTYRQHIIDLLGLTNVALTQGHELDVRSGDHDHAERMWVEYENLPGRTYEIVHLNDTVRPYSCWISAVYHVRRDPQVKKRIDIEGRLIRVDPLLRWSQEDIATFMRATNLPYHERARRRRETFVPDEISEPPGWHF